MTGLNQSLKFSTG